MKEEPIIKRALQVKGLTKVYKLYEKPADRLVEIFLGKKKHKLFYANRDVSFELYEGETLGIIGVNGAGKSTLLKQIAGVIDPTEGIIERSGRVTALLELGTGFNPEFTGRENIYLNGMLIGMKKEEIAAKEDAIVEFSELGSFIDEPLRTYSSGMAMRLAFSIAIHSSPQIFIVDEALSVGDAHFSAKCTRTLKELKAKNLSIIYVSHDLNSLKLLCDRLLLLNRGRIVEEGDPEKVINRYNFLIAKLNDQEDISSHESSFGQMDIVIHSVDIVGAESSSAVVSSGEKVQIRVTVSSKIKKERMTVGIVIRDRFGQDIFGTNTFHHGQLIDFAADETKTILFTMAMNIGPGKYSLSAAVHSDETHLQECQHWLDNAAEFEVAGIRGALFTGLCRLEPTVTVL